MRPDIIYSSMWPIDWFNTTNVKNMHLNRDSTPGLWNTVPNQSCLVAARGEQMAASSRELG